MTAVAPDTLALQRLYHWETTTPDRVVFTQPYDGASKGGPVRTWTWKQALEETRRMAAHLQSLGLPPGSHIAMISKNCAHWLMTDWAIWMAGHVSVPLYPTLASDTIRQILVHSEAKLLFVGKLDGWDGMKAGVPQGLPCITYPLSPANAVPGAPTWDDIVKKHAPLAGNPVRPADELCTIMYTSGTTGMPKGVMHTFGNFAWSVQSGLKRVPIDNKARMLSYLPLSHIAERTLVEHGMIATGMEVFFAESLDTFTLDLQRAKPTVFFSVPRLWVKFQQGVLAKMPREKLEKLLRIPILSGIVKKKILKQLGLDSVRFAGTGAAPLPPEVMARYRSLGLELLEGYGMTEQFAYATSNMPGRSKIGSVGEATACTEVKLSPEGEILTRGPAHMQGYYKEPEKTAETMTDDGWLRTGDLGSFDAQGRLSIVGRAKEQFKTSKGKYVAPAPIEGKLAAFTRIEACMVTGSAFPQPFALAMLPAGAWDAVAAQRDEFTAALKSHLDKVNEQLDPHERLDFIAVVQEQWTVESGFVTPTLKLKRNVLEKHYGGHFERWAKQRREVVWHDAA